MTNVVEHLKWLCSPDAERLSDFERINQFVKYGLELITEIDRLEDVAESEEGPS